MAFNIEMIKKVYDELKTKVDKKAYEKLEKEVFAVKRGI